MASPIRILTAVPICDGHDSAITTINLEFIRHGKPRAKRSRVKSSDIELAHKLTEIEDAKGKRPMPNAQPASAADGLRRGERPTSKPETRVIGFTGPGGAGKTTLIDELVLRFLNKDRQSRVAILSHDPSVIGEGALLGDRATMINSQNDQIGRAHV